MHSADTQRVRLLVQLEQMPEYWPKTGGGRALTLVIALYAFAVFGYITATLASFFIDRDEERRWRDDP